MNATTKFIREMKQNLMTYYNNSDAVTWQDQMI